MQICNTGDPLSKVTAEIRSVNVYHYTNGPRHLNSITGADASARSFDANGNTTALQANGWTYGLGYNNTNRLSLIQQNGSTIMQYKLDGKGKRVRKVPASGSATEYVYDETGKLLYEYISPTSSRSYIWADDTLIATVEADSSIHYVYTDHLGTPRAVTTTTSSTPIWTWPWTQNPFGEKPASGSGYSLNVRFPGQYFDAETGLVYNGRRDYEPPSGRYIESDPIGVTAGPSTYAYVDSNPLDHIDPSGLFKLVSDFSGSGGVFCDYSGTWRTFVDLPPPFDECPAIGICALAHEQSHIQDANWANPGLCRWYKPLLLGNSFLAPSSDNERKFTELKAYNAEYECLERFLKSLRCDDDKCKALIQQREEDIRDVLVPEVMNGTYGGY